jgi:hypothetical protein
VAGGLPLPGSHRQGPEGVLGNCARSQTVQVT